MPEISNSSVTGYTPEAKMQSLLPKQLHCDWLQAWHELQVLPAKQLMCVTNCKHGMGCRWCLLSASPRV